MQLERRREIILSLVRQMTTTIETGRWPAVVTAQLVLACRTLLAMLLLRRPSPGAPKAQREAFKMLCAEVQVWLRDEIAEIRRFQRASKAPAPRSKPRPKIGHA